MRFDSISLGGNVIRFPVELRAKPSILLLLGNAPDLREATLIAEAFGLDPPDSDARDNADRAMAERIALTIFPVNARRAPQSTGRNASADARPRRRRLRGGAPGGARG